MADILENPVDLIDDAYEQEIQVEQEMIEVVAYRSYNRLDDKPQINGVELVGNKTSSDLGITAQIESAVNSETQARAQADNTLQGKIDTEKLARQQADSTLQGNIDAEETARKAADKDIQDVLDGETLARQNADTALGGRIDTEIHDRQVADIALQGQIDAITSKSDVVDVVATYADLQAYDTQHLGDNDVIKVLDDETHEDALTYYRWSTTTQTWTYIGQESPYYSKSQTDTLLLGKQNTIDSSHKLSADLVTDTSTTNKFVTASDITNWNAKQDALTAGNNIDITDGVISTPAIAPEVVAELPATGTEGKLYLTPKNYTTGTATGNPITISLGEDAGQIDSFQLDGDTTQTTYAGKNLINPIAISGKNNGITYSFDQTTNEITLDGTATAKSTCYFSNENRISLDGEYTLSYEKVSGSIAPSGTCRIEIAASSWGSNTIYLALQDSSASITATKTFEVFALDFNIGQGTVCNNFKLKLQLEKSASATSYEPFVGRQPSPSPEYPQQIQTVTGTQTISINGTNYPIDLGDIQLCGLGDDGNGNPLYKDYIYPDGEDWKVHKATGKHLFNGGEAFTSDGSVQGIYQFRWTDSSVLNNSNQTIALVASDKFRGVIWNSSWTKDFSVVQVVLQTALRFMTSLSSSVEGFKTWLASNNAVVHYALATPTDTTITDTALIAQLEAIRTASLQASNTITNSATGSNLAGNMEIGYYEFDPTNRYDKWLWLDLNNNYEKLGS